MTRKVISWGCDLMESITFAMIWINQAHDQNTSSSLSLAQLLKLSDPHADVFEKHEAVLQAIHNLPNLWSSSRLQAIHLRRESLQVGKTSFSIRDKTSKFTMTILRSILIILSSDERLTVTTEYSALEFTYASSLSSFRSSLHIIICFN